MKKAAMAGLVLVLAGDLYGAQSVSPLVDGAWVRNNACQPGVVLLDVRSEKIDGQSKDDYLKAHLPCAVHTDYVKAGWRAKRGDVPGMLPPVEKLEAMIGDLGIDNDTHVVIVPLGMTSSSMGSATRVYWTFKVLGHDGVSILDGGHAGYSSNKDNTLDAGDYSLPAKAFKASLRDDMLVSEEDVKSAMDKSVPMVDNRNPDLYLGINRNAKTRRHGTLSGAANLPFEWLTVNNAGRFRSVEGLREAYRMKGISLEGDQINFCNTGHLASMGWFASSELLGNKQARVYDGSMAEWSRNDELPMERKISMKE